MAKIQFDEADLDLDAFKDSTTNLWDRKPFEVLQRYLQPDGDLSLSETSRLILAMQPDQPLKKGQFSIWNNIGYHVLAVSRQIPYNHPSQIKLALLMKRLASAKKASAEYTGDDGNIYYTSLGEFQMTVQEFFGPDISDPPDEPNEHDHYINLSAFIARLMTERIIEHPDLILSLMIDAFENDPSRLTPLLRNAFVRAAAMYIIYAGQTAFSNIVLLPDMDELNGDKRMEAGPMYNGPVAGLKRWAFWKKGFEAAVESSDSTDGCKKLAGKAAQLMACLETSMML